MSVSNTQNSVSPNLIYNESGSNITKINLDDEETYHSFHTYDGVVNNILSGNIQIDGGIIDTPPNMSISLKSHQKRMIYEMLHKEQLDQRITSKINAFVLADKVGSGKSIVVLGLICNSIIVNKLQSNKLVYKLNKYHEFRGFYLNCNQEFKTNLIVVPHGIFNQWLNYIKEYTQLTYYAVSFSNDLKNIPYEKMLKGECDVLLVKSTKYNDFMKTIYTKYPYSIKNTNSILTNCHQALEQELYSNIYRVYTNCRDHNYNKNFLENLSVLKSSINKIDIDKLKEDIEKAGKFKLDMIYEYSGPVFQRVFIDEANSIKIAKCMPAYGKINWFITSSVEDLLYSNGKKNYQSGKILVNGIKGLGFIKETFSNNNGKHLTNFVQDTYLKNMDSFVESSFDLPDPIENKISCFTPHELKILQGVAMPEVIQALNAGDVTSAINKVGCNITNENSIVDIVLKNLNIEHENKTNLLKTKMESETNINNEIEILKENINHIKSNLENNGIIDDENNGELSVEQLDLINKKEILEEKRNSKNNIKKSVKLYTDQVKDLKFKIESLKSRITDIDKKECPICAQIVSSPVVTPCCNNVFCFACIAQAMHYSVKKECPLCRNPDLDLNKLTAISSMESKKEDDNEKLPTKIESLINLITSKADGRFLVFSEYENSFNEIVNELNKNKIVYSKLCGSTGHITNLIRKYTNNEIKVLLLNAKHYGSGLNLQMTSDIVIYHRMSNDLEKQIIGRGQRVGRDKPLCINYLCYENEN